MSKSQHFPTEAALVAKFCELVAARSEREPKWTPYHETGGWDVLLVGADGTQIGIEAKLSLNAKVIEQALPQSRWSDAIGPDCRAVLVPEEGLQNHLAEICHHLGIVVISVSARENWRKTGFTFDFSPRLPDVNSRWDCRDWPDWLPAERHKLPEYVPDVIGGHASPLTLSQWKIRAIKLLILLDRYGVVTRKDMKALDLSPTRWTAAYHGFLDRTPEGYVRSARTPDLKAQHPVNWAQIEADFDTWAPKVRSPDLALTAQSLTTQ